MACLVVKPENHLKNGFHDVTTNLSPEKLELLEKRRLVVQLSKDVPPFFNQSAVMSSETPAKKLKTEETIQRYYEILRTVLIQVEYSQRESSEHYS